jgi:hypothetical protein
LASFTAADLILAPRGAELGYRAPDHGDPRPVTVPRSGPSRVTAVANFLMTPIRLTLCPLGYSRPDPILTVVIMEPTMINWPEMLRHAEGWAGGFWAGAGAASLMVIAGVAMVLLVRAI